MSVLGAVQADVSAMDKVKPGLGGSSEAALALALAARLDDPGTPASAVGQIAARLLDSLEVLRARAPETEMSALDKLRDRRAKRGAKTSDRVVAA